MWQRIVNFILLRGCRLKRISKRLDRLGAEATEEVLELLLRAMALAFRFWPDYRKNLQGFEKQFQFTTDRDPSFNVAVVYRNNRMRVCERWLPEPDVRIDFHDYWAVLALLRNPQADVVNEMLNQRLRVTGNLNYLLKFGYMLRHLLHLLHLVR